jgi:tRNA U34 5-carboxymethylaminomethyl modifying GTPase MnmE/TrmE
VPADKYEAWRTALAKCLAHTEAVIDFGDDDDSVDDSAFSAVRPKVPQQLTALHSTLVSALLYCTVTAISITATVRAAGPV